MARRHEQAAEGTSADAPRSLTIAPLYDRPDVVSDEQLLDVLHNCGRVFAAPAKDQPR